MIKRVGVVLLMVFFAICSYAEQNDQTPQPVPDQPASPSSINPVDMSGNMALGLNYPGLSFRYGLSSNFVLEGKYQTSEGVSLYGPRLYYMFLNYADSVLCFSGVEIDMLTFKGDESSGSGMVASIFAGGEYYIWKNISFQLDVGPALVTLNDSQYSLSQSGLEFVINLGVNFHLVTGGK